MIPARTISAMYAASLRPNPSSAATNPGISVLALAWMNEGPNGIPRSMVGNSAPMKFQNSNCTSNGVPRKNQM